KFFRLVMTQHRIGATVEHIADMTRQKILALISEGLVKAGYEELAVRAHLRSLLQRSAMMPTSVVREWAPPSALTDLVLNYYGILHEIGHCKSVPQSPSGDLSKAGIEAQMQKDQELEIKERVIPFVEGKTSDATSKLDLLRGEVADRLDGKSAYDE